MERDYVDIALVRQRTCTLSRGLKIATVDLIESRRKLASLVAIIAIRHTLTVASGYNVINF